MTMTFSVSDSRNTVTAPDSIDAVEYYMHSSRDSEIEGFHILKEKLRIPDTRGLIDRPRINALLRKSIDQFPATLISGRAGTGKTALAASFAGDRQNISWYSVESTDIEWRAFSRYFSESLSKNVYGKANRSVLGLHDKKGSQDDIARFLVNRFSPAYAGPSAGSSMIVLDDIHHIFDAAWFGDFFNFLLYSLPPETHLLLLCRSKPPGPLWRLRSKQMLNVIDEKVIAFDTAETQALFEKLGLPASSAQEAQRSCFGRISKLLQFAEDLDSALSPSQFLYS